MASRICSSAWRPSGARRSRTHGSSRRKIPGRISAAKRAATDHASGSPRSAASSSHSASVTGARNCGWQQQAVLGEEPREQQPVPLLVRALRDEQVAVVAQLAPLRAKPIAEGRLRGIEMFRTPVGEHAEALDGSARRRLRRTTGGEHRRLELLSEEGGQGAHGWPQMITVVPASRCDCTSARSWSKYGVGSSPGLKVADGGLTSTLVGSSFLAAR